jgi:flagellar hook-length control protein FliK
VHSPSAAPSALESPFHKSLAAARSRQSDSVKSEQSPSNDLVPSDPACDPQSPPCSSVVSDQAPPSETKPPQPQSNDAESMQGSTTHEDSPPPSQPIPNCQIVIPAIALTGGAAAAAAPAAHEEATPLPQPNEPSASVPAPVGHAVHVQLPPEAVQVDSTVRVVANPEAAVDAGAAQPTASTSFEPPSDFSSPAMGAATTAAPTPIQVPPPEFAESQPHAPQEFQAVASQAASSDQSKPSQESTRPNAAPHVQTTEPPVNAPVIQRTDASDEEPAAGEGQQPARQRSGPNRPVVQGDSQMAPATSRAMQVDAAVRLENATGQPPTTDAAPRPAVHSIPMNHSAATLTSLGANPGSAAAPTDLSNHPQAFTADEAQFSSRVVRGLSAMVNQRGGVMNMRLDPPELGQLRVQMTIIRGTVSADFQAATPQAHALLEKNMVALRNALEGQGLTVERLAVHVAPSGAVGGVGGSTDDAR